MEQVHIRAVSNHSREAHTLLCCLGSYTESLPPHDYSLSRHLLDISDVKESQQNYRMKKKSLSSEAKSIIKKFFFIHLFTCAYMVWVTAPPCAILSSPTPLASRQNLEDSVEEKT
jgi:hypothetical protein